MSDNEIVQIVRILVPYIKKELLKDSEFKNTQRVTQAEVVEINEDSTFATVQLPFDSNTFTAAINTTDAIEVGDKVFLTYWGDLKNAHITYKNKERE